MTSYVQLFLETGRTFCLTTTLKEVCVYWFSKWLSSHSAFDFTFLNFWDLMWVSGETHFPCHFFRRKLKWLLNLSSLSHIEPRHRFCTKDGNYLSSGKVISIFRVMLLWAYKHRKNCDCCPGHHLIINHYSSMSWFKFRNLSVIVNSVTKSLIH